MTFADQESSADSGEPVELYEFMIGATVSRFTTAEDSQTIGGVVYTPLSVKRSRLVVGPEDRNDVLELEVPASTTLVRQYINVPPGSKAELTISRFHRTDGAEEVQTLFKGVVSTVGFSVLGLTAKIGVAPLTSSFNRTIPRFVFSGLCNHVLYSGQCSVNSSLHRVASTISAVDGSDSRIVTITGIVAAIAATSQGAGTAQVIGGYVTTDGVSFRSVRAEVDANRLQLWLPFPEDVTGQSVEVFAGCRHDLDDCGTVFDNIEGQSGSGGFGGFGWVPRDNVFSKGLPQ